MNGETYQKLKDFHERPLELTVAAIRKMEDPSISGERGIECPLKDEHRGSNDAFEYLINRERRDPGCSVLVTFDRDFDIT